MSKTSTGTGKVQNKKKIGTIPVPHRYAVPVPVFLHSENDKTIFNNKLIFEQMEP